MDSMTLASVVLFALTEVLVVAALLTPEWVVSHFAGETKLGVAVSCHSSPDSDLLCDFPLHHPAWRAALAMMTLAIVVFSATIILLVVSLRMGMRGHGGTSTAFRKGGMWTGLLGVLLLCLTGIVFPAGFATDRISSQPYLLPETFSVGYSYIFLHIAVVTSIVGEAFTHRLCAPRNR